MFIKWMDGKHPQKGGRGQGNKRAWLSTTHGIEFHYHLSRQETGPVEVQLHPPYLLNLPVPLYPNLTLPKSTDPFGLVIKGL